MAKAELEQAIADLGLVVLAEFVPYSQSRNFKKDAKVSERSLNWQVSLVRVTPANGHGTPEHKRTILTTDYSAGIGHCPAYTASIRDLGHRDSIMRAEAITREIETGKSYPYLKSIKIQPDSCDVIYSLIQDASVLDHSSFESWASDYGYDVDSRKAESIYRECLATALALRNGIGEAGLAQLQKAAEDY